MIEDFENTDPPVDGNTDGNTDGSQNGTGPSNNVSIVPEGTYISQEDYGRFTRVPEARVGGGPENLAGKYAKGWLYDFNANDYQAANQPDYIAVTNSVINAIPYVLGESISFAGTALEMSPVNLLSESFSPDFQNFLITLGDSIKEFQPLDVYAKRSAQQPESFSDMLDPEFWANNMNSIASTLAILIPAGLGARVTKLGLNSLKSFVGINAVKGTVSPKMLKKYLDLRYKPQDAIKEAVKATNRTERFQDALNLSIWSRSIESASLAKEAYEKTLAMGGNNTQAGNAALEAYKYGYAGLITDLFQTAGMLGAFKFNVFSGDSLGKKFANFVFNYTGQGLGEGLEEVYQSIITNEAAKTALRGEKIDLAGDISYADYMKDPEIMQSFVLGAAGGLAFQAAGDLGRNAIKRLSAFSLNKKTADEESYNEAIRVINDLSDDGATPEGQDAIESLQANREARERNFKNPFGKLIGSLSGVKNWFGKQVTRAKEKIMSLGAEGGFSNDAVQYQTLKLQRKLALEQSKRKDLTEFERQAVDLKLKEIESEINNFEKREGFKPSDYTVDTTSDKWGEINDLAEQSLRDELEAKSKHFELEELKKGKRSEKLLEQERKNFKSSLKNSNSYSNLDSLIKEIDNALEQEQQRDEKNPDYENELSQRKAEVFDAFSKKLRTAAEKVNPKEFDNVGEYQKELLKDPFIASLPDNLKAQFLENARQKFNEANNIKTDTKERPKGQAPVYKKGSIVSKDGIPYKVIEVTSDKYVLEEMGTPKDGSPKKTITVSQADLEYENNVRDRRFDVSFDTPLEVSEKYEKRLAEINNQINKLAKKKRLTKKDKIKLAELNEEKKNLFEELGYAIIDPILYDIEFGKPKKESDEDDGGNDGDEGDDGDAGANEGLSKDEKVIADLERKLEELEQKNGQPKDEDQIKALNELIILVKKSETVTKNPNLYKNGKLLEGAALEEAIKEIQKVIDKLLNNDITYDQADAIIHIDLGYSLNKLKDFEGYLRAISEKDFPEYKNNKQSFASWIRGTYDKKQTDKKESNISGIEADIERKRKEELQSLIEEKEKIEKEIEDLEKGSKKSINNRVEEEVEKRYNQKKESFENEFREAGFSEKQIEEFREDEKKIIRKKIEEEFKESKNTKIGEDKLFEYGIETDKEYTATEIGDKLLLSGLNKKLWNLLVNIAEKLGVKIEFVTNFKLESYINGIFELKENKIYINVGAFGDAVSTKKKNLKSQLSKLIVHEYIHGVTAYVTESVLKGNTSKLNSKQIQAVERLKIILKEVQEVLGTFDRFNITDMSLYGVSNIDELLAELSNPEFVKKLKSIKSRKAKNLLEKIKQFFADLFGIGKTAFDEVFDVFNNLLVEFNTEARIEASKNASATYFSINNKYQQLKQKLAEINKKIDKINAKYDSEYVKAVKEGTLTKEQAIQALERAGRKNSIAYKKLPALKDEKAIIQKRVQDTISKIFGSDELFNFDENQEGTRVRGEFIPKNLGEQLFNAINKTLKGEVQKVDKKEANKYYRELVKKLHPDKYTDELIKVVANEFMIAANTAREKGYINVLKELETKFDEELTALKSKPKTEQSVDINGDILEKGSPVKLLTPTGIKNNLQGEIIEFKSPTLAKVQVEGGNIRTVSTKNLELIKEEEPGDQGGAPGPSEEELTPLEKIENFLENIWVSEANDTSLNDDQRRGFNNLIRLLGNKLFFDINIEKFLSRFKNSIFKNLKDPDDTNYTRAFNKIVRSYYSKARKLGLIEGRNAVHLEKLLEVLINKFEAISSGQSPIFSSTDEQVFFDELIEFIGEGNINANLIAQLRSSSSFSDSPAIDATGEEKIFTVDLRVRFNEEDNRYELYLDKDKNPIVNGFITDGEYEKAGVTFDVDFSRSMYEYGDVNNFTVKFELPTQLEYNQRPNITESNVAIVTVIYDENGGKHYVGTLPVSTEGKVMTDAIRKELYNNWKRNPDKPFIESSGSAVISTVYRGYFLDTNEKNRKPTSQVWGDEGKIAKVFAGAVPDSNRAGEFKLTTSFIPDELREELMSLEKQLQEIISSSRLKDNESNFFILTRDTRGKLTWARVHEINVGKHPEVKSEVDAIFEEIRQVSERAKELGIENKEALEKTDDEILSNWRRGRAKELKNQLLGLVRFREERKKGKKTVTVVEPDFNSNLIFVPGFQNIDGVFEPKKYINSRKIYDRPSQINFSRLKEPGYIDEVIDRTETALPSGVKLASPEIYFTGYEVPNKPENKTTTQKRSSSREEPKEEESIKEDVVTPNDYNESNDPPVEDYEGDGEFFKDEDEIREQEKKQFKVKRASSRRRSKGSGNTSLYEEGGETYTLDENQARENLRSILGDFPLKIIDGLINVGSFQAYGLARRAFIEISKLAPNRTVFHEAFHIIFNGVLSKEDRTELFREAKERYNITKNDLRLAKASYRALVQKFGKQAMQSSYPNMTEEQAIQQLALEEKMADEFQDYRIQDTGVRGFLRKLFRTLKNFIRRVTGNWSKIDDLFRRINLGEYKNAYVKDFASGGFSPLKFDSKQRAEIVSTLFSYFDESIEDLLKTNSLTSIYKYHIGQKNIEDNYFISLQKDTALNILVEDLYLDIEEDVAEIDEGEILSIVQSLRPDVKEIKFSQEEVIDEEGTAYTVGNVEFITEGDPKPGYLYYDVLSAFTERGFTVNIKDMTLSSITSEVESTLDDTNKELDTLDEEKGSQAEYWAVNQAEISPKKSITNELRRVLARIQKDKTGFHGLAVYYTPSEIYPSLQRAIGGSTKVENMVRKIQFHETFRKSLYPLIKNYKEDQAANDLVNQLFSIAQLSHSDNKVVLYEEKFKSNANKGIPSNVPAYLLEEVKSEEEVEEENSLKIINSNRGSLVNTIKNQLEDLYIETEKDPSNKSNEFSLDDFLVSAPSETVSVIEKKDELREKLEKLLSSALAKRKASDNKGKNSFYEFVDELMKYYPENWQEVTYSVDGKILYLWNTSGFINYFFNKIAEETVGIGAGFSNFIKSKFFSDPLYKKLPILDQTWGELREMTVMTLEGFKEAFQKRGVRSKNFNASEHWNALLGAWINNGNKKYGHIPAPIYSDSPVHELIKVPKLDESGVRQGIQALINFENERNATRYADNLKINAPKAYKNNVGKRFFITEEMGKNDQEVLEWIDRQIEGDPENGVEGLVDIILNDDDISLGKKYSDRKALKGLLTDFMRNHMAYFGQIVLITGGDPAFYKSDKDGSVIDTFFKRIKQIHSSKTIPNTSAFYNVLDENGDVKEKVEVPSTIRNIIYRDVEVESDVLHHLKQVLTPEQLKGYKELSRTDGNSFSSLVSMRYKMISIAGGWNHAKQKVWEILMEGKLPTSKQVQAVLNESKIPNSLKNEIQQIKSFETIKPFVYTLIFNDLQVDSIEEGSQVLSPFQKKDSEAYMLPFEAFPEINGKENPFYNEFYRQAMEAEGFVFNDADNTVDYSNVATDVAYTHVFDSTLKVYKEDLLSEEEQVRKEQEYSEKLNEKYSELRDQLMSGEEISQEKIDEIDDTINSELPIEFFYTIEDGEFKVMYDRPPEHSDGTYFIDHAFEDWGKQQSNPNNYADKESLFGTQLMKKLVADMFEMNPKNAKRIIKSYQAYIINTINENYQSLLGELNNWDDLINKLRSEFINRSKKDPSYLEALNIIDAKAKKTRLPLWHPFLSYEVEKLINSYFRNKVTKVKLKHGFSLTNKSNYGYVRKPRLRFEDENGNLINPDDVDAKVHKLAYAEVILPMSIHKTISAYANKDGFIDDESFAKIPDELKEVIAYRIPTEDKNSVMRLKVIGFHPFSDNIILPDEFVVITGGDFDIDKMKGFFKTRLENMTDLLKERSGPGAEFRENKRKEIKDQKNKTKDQINREIRELEMDDMANLRKLAEQDEKLLAVLAERQRLTKNHNNFFDLIYHDILGDPTQTQAQLRPGAFPDINKAAEKYGEKKKLDLVDPRTIVDIAQRMNTGAGLIGIGATFSSAKSIWQLFDMYITRPFNIARVNSKKIADVLEDGLVNAFRNELRTDFNKNLPNFLNGAAGQLLFPESKVNLQTVFVAKLMDMVDTVDKVHYKKESGDFIEPSELLEDINSLEAKLQQALTDPNLDLKSQKDIAVEYINSLVNYTINIVYKDDALAEYKDSEVEDLFTSEFLQKLSDTQALNRMDLSDMSLDKDIEGKDTTNQNVNQHVTAFVDHGKDPKSEKININPYTADYQLALVSMGLTIDQAAAVLNHPVMKNISKLAAKEKKKISDYLDTQPWKGDNFNAPDALIFDEDSNILNSDFEVESYLAYIAPRVKEISDLVRHTREADKGAGPGNASTFAKHLTYIQHMDLKYIYGVTDMFRDDEIFYMKHLYEKGILGPLSFMINDLNFPNILGDGFHKIVSSFANIKGSNLNDVEIVDLYRSYMDFIAYEHYDFENFETGTKAFNLKKIQKYYPNNKFISRLRKTKKGYLVFHGNTANDPDEDTKIRNDFALLKEEHKNYLKQYAFFSSGLVRPKKDGFAHLQSLDVFLEDGLSEHYESVLENRFNDEDDVHIQRFIDQYLRNFYRDIYYINNVNYKDKNIKKFFKNLVSKDNKIVTKDLPYSGPYIKIKKGIKVILLKWDNETKTYYSVSPLGVYENKAKRIIEYYPDQQYPYSRYNNAPVGRILDAYDGVVNLKKSKESGLAPTFFNNPSTYVDPIDLNEEQQLAVDKVTSFVKTKDDDFFLLYGRPGTGKTTVVARIVKELQDTKKILLTASTHDAVHELKEHFTVATGGINPKNTNFRTLHSALGYRQNPQTKEFEVDPDARNYAEEVDVIIVDEASTISDDLFKTLSEIREDNPEVKIIYVGDNAQHAPVRTMSELIELADEMGLVDEADALRREVEKGDERSDSIIQTIVSSSKLDDLLSAPFRKASPENSAELLERVRQGEKSSIHKYSDIYIDNIFSDDPVRDPRANVPNVDTDEITHVGAKEPLPERAIEMFKEAVKNLDHKKIVIIGYTNELRNNFNDRIRNLIYEEPAAFEKGEFIIFNRNYYNKALKIDIKNNSKFQILDKPKENKFTINELLASRGLPTADNPELGELEVTYYMSQIDTLTSGKVTIPIVTSNTYKNISRLKNHISKKQSTATDKKAVNNYEELISFLNSVTSVDYAYAITSHKVEGATYENVVVLEDSFIKENARFSEKSGSRGLLVAITRAQNEVFLVSRKYNDYKASTKKKGEGKKIEYTPLRSKERKTFTVIGDKIFDESGTEVFKENDNKDRIRLSANLAVSEGRAVIVTHKSKKYIVNTSNKIISAAKGMILSNSNRERNAILELARKKFEAKKATPQSSKQTGKVNTISMQPDNVTKVLSGKKTTTLRTNNLPSGIYNIGGQQFNLTNRGLLSVKEAGGVEAITKSEAFAESGPKFSSTKEFLAGKRKLYVYDITPVQSSTPQPTSTGRKTYTGKVTSLEPNQVFVFGSNEGGSKGQKPTHGAGSARIARDKFGAIQGQTKGAQGQSYAIVTKKFYDVVKSSTPQEITSEIAGLYAYARQNPDKEFLVSDYSGRNLNGYTAEEMAEMFINAAYDQKLVEGNVGGGYSFPPNIVHNENFQKVIDRKLKRTQPTQKPSPQPTGKLLTLEALSPELRGIVETMLYDTSNIKLYSERRKIKIEPVKKKPDSNTTYGFVSIQADMVFGDIKTFEDFEKMALKEFNRLDTSKSITFKDRILFDKGTSSEMVSWLKNQLLLRYGLITETSSDGLSLNVLGLQSNKEFNSFYMRFPYTPETEGGQIQAMRVSQYYDPGEKSGNLLESAGIIGTKADSLVRDYFADELKDFVEYELSSENEIKKFLEQLAVLKAHFIKNNEVVISNEITLFDEDLGIAGTLDILTVDTNGVFRIYDMKTNRSYPFFANEKTGLLNYDKLFKGDRYTKRQKHTTQLSLYNILMNNNYGINAKDLNIIQIKVFYNAGNLTTSELKYLTGDNLEGSDVLFTKLDKLDQVIDAKLDKNMTKNFKPNEIFDPVMQAKENIRQSIASSDLTSAEKTKALEQLDKAKTEKQLGAILKKYCNS